VSGRLRGRERLCRAVIGVFAASGERRRVAGGRLWPVR
jgi:hypothetical protein